MTFESPEPEKKDRQQDDSEGRAEELLERWQVWQGEEPEPEPEPTGWLAGLRQRWVEWRLARRERARRRLEERLAAREFGWRHRYLEWRLEREERARFRREQKAAQAAARLEERANQAALAMERRRRFREKVRYWSSLQWLAGETGVLSRRRTAILFVLAVILVSNITGALLMRARHRRYLVGTLVAVNGVSIRRDVFFDEMFERYGENTLKMLVERELRQQFLRSKGAIATDKQVEERLRIEKTMPDFVKTLQERGIVEADYREALKNTLSEINLLTRGVTATEEEARAFYRMHTDPRNIRAMFYTPPRVQLAVIVTPDEATARKALAELKAGTAFAQVALRYSLHDSAPYGGYVEPFYLGRSYTAMASGLDELGRKLQENQQIGPVKMGPVWWIARCIEKVPARTRPYEEVRHTALLLAKLSKGIQQNQKRLAEEYEEFRKRATIQWFAAR